MSDRGKCPGDVTYWVILVRQWWWCAERVQVCRGVNRGQEKLSTLTKTTQRGSDRATSLIPRSLGWNPIPSWDSDKNKNKNKIQITYRLRSPGLMATNAPLSQILSNLPIFTLPERQKEKLQHFMCERSNLEQDVPRCSLGTSWCSTHHQGIRISRLLFFTESRGMLIWVWEAVHFLTV